MQQSALYDLLMGQFGKGRNSVYNYGWLSFLKHFFIWLKLFHNWFWHVDKNEYSVSLEKKIKDIRPKLKNDRKSTSLTLLLYWYHFLCLRKFRTLRKQFFNQKIIEQKSNSNIWIDTTDAKSSRYPNSHKVFKQSHLLE